MVEIVELFRGGWVVGGPEGSGYGGWEDVGGGRIESVEKSRVMGVPGLVGSLAGRVECDILEKLVASGKTDLVIGAGLGREMVVGEVGVWRGGEAGAVDLGGEEELYVHGEWARRWEAAGGP